MSMRRRMIIASSVVAIDAPAEWRYECPVCGVDLSRSNFETPAIDYFCPVCTTRQTPLRRAAATARGELS
jgi:hypothetical protein